MKGDMVLRKCLVLVALLIGPSIEVTAQSDIQPLLEQGRNLYYAARFSEAVKVLSAAEQLFGSSTPPAEATSVKVYLAASYYALRDTNSAIKTFVEICRTDPAYNISAVEFNPSIVDLFQQAKQQCAASACETTCASLRSVNMKRDSEQIKKAAEAARQCGCDDERRMAGQVLFEIATDHYQKKQYPLAQGEFQSAVELNPSLRSQVPGLGKVVVTLNGIGGRLFVDDELQTELKPNEPYESSLLPAGKHQLKVEPGGGYETVEEEVTIEADGRAPVNLSPRPLTVTPRPVTETPDRQPSVQTATLAQRALLDLETGSQTGAGVDLMWVEINQIRHMIPQRGARFGVMRDSRAFELITADELRKQVYSAGSIGTKDDPIRAGMIVAVQTVDGGTAKLRIDSVGTSLTIRWVVYR
jgi:tetratricopeptide (TPR) repeat protein